MPSTLPLLLLLLLLAAAAALTASATVNVTVDHVVLHLDKSEAEFGEEHCLNRRVPLRMTCRAEAAPPLRLSADSFDWRKVSAGGGVSNESLARREPRASYQADCAPDGLSCASTLTIRDPLNADAAAAYECRVTPQLGAATGAAATVAATVTATGRFLSRPLITLQVGKTDKYDLAAWPGDTVEITCLVEGSPPGDIRWTKERDPGFSLTGNATLRLGGLSYERDRGKVTCLSRNDYGANSAAMFLRVRSPTAYVAPLVAIGLELAAMLAIVAAYELYMRRQRLRKSGEDAADGPGDGVDGAVGGDKTD